MKTNKHTPGPWYYKETSAEQGLIISEETGENIAVSYKVENAPILAAAPKMREMLQAIVALINGEWDNPALKNRGPVSTRTIENIEAWALEALTESQ